MDVIQKLKVKAKKVEQEAAKKCGKVAFSLDKKKELEEVLIDAIDKTRLLVFKRRLA